MRTLYFPLLVLLFIALVRADGSAYTATWYGGPDDHNREKNPSCLSSSMPNTDYYAAVSTTYDKDLCNNYAVVMAVDNKNERFLGKMVKVRIVDSCSECERSHIDLSRYAFRDIRDKEDGIFPVIWLAGTTDGKVSRELVYPSSKTEEFAKLYGLSKSQFISMYRKQAIKMIVNGISHATFNKYDVVTTKKTTTAARTTTVARTTAVASTTSHSSSSTTSSSSSATSSSSTSTNVDLDDDTSNPVVDDIENPEAEEIPMDDETPEDVQTKDANQDKVFTDEDVKELESQFPDKENNGTSYAAGIISGVITVSGAAGIGLLYLKKQSPGKYDELKQKFPDAFGNLKRSVSKSASQFKKGVSRTASTISKKSIRKKKSGHISISLSDTNSDIFYGNYSFGKDNYREMPDYMFGNSDEIPMLKDDSFETSFPEPMISLSFPKNSPLV